MLNNPNILIGTPTKLAQAAITASPVAIYTVPDNTKTAIFDLLLCNTSSAVITVSVYAGAAATTANALLYSYAMPANGIFQMTCFQVLNAADKITVSASATGVTATISGMAQI